LVGKLLSIDPGAFEKESDSVNAVLAFNENCKRPAASDLIFYPEVVFGDH
jgi:hypothetical protein